MSAEDKQFPQKWGFRRNDSNVDSSSDDPSRPSSASEPKRKKHNLDTRLFPDGNDQQAVHSPQSHPGGENHSSHDEPKKQLNKSCEKQERKSRTRKADRKASGKEPSSTALICLRRHMESLVEGVKVAREDLLKWMTNEMEKSFKDDKMSEPAESKKGQRRGSKEAQKTNTKRSATPISNPIKPRRRPGKVTKNPKDGSSSKLSLETKPSHESSEVAIPLNEPAENADNGTTPVEKSQNQRVKRKRLRSSAKKQTIPEENQQTDNHPTLPLVVPSQEAANNERTNSEGGNGERYALSRNGLINLSSQPNSTPRFENRNEIFDQNGLRNVGDYEQNTVGNVQLTGMGNSNGNGSVFPFAMPSQGINGGFSMPNFPSPFGLQYLSQEGFMSGLRMNHGFNESYGAGLRMNRGFNESYGAYNQQLRMKGQGGLMPLHPSDNIRTGNLQPR